jgi:cardiolipin synthase
VDVRLFLPAKSDVVLSRFAARHLYAGLFRAGISIFEYVPQMVHAKVFLVDDVVYVGSSNLDPRSLYLNYEIMIRTTRPEALAGAHGTFCTLEKRSSQLDPATWFKARTWSEKLRERWAYFLLYRVDPWVSGLLSR